MLAPCSIGSRAPSWSYIACQSAFNNFSCRNPSLRKAMSEATSPPMINRTQLIPVMSTLLLQPCEVQRDQKPAKEANGIESSPQSHLVELRYQAFRTFRIILILLTEGFTQRLLFNVDTIHHRYQKRDHTES